LRNAYQDQQASGLMTLEELGAKLKDLDETRSHAESELRALKDSQAQLEELEADRDALLESISGEIPESLDSLDGEERNTVYRMLRLEVMPTPEGRYELTGAFCTAEPLSA
jgi:DNA repair exonuclease SbcCD ATPase subunit